MINDLYDELIGELSKNYRYIDSDNNVLIERVKRKAWDCDKDLVELLLGNVRFKKAFFYRVGGNDMFHNNEFVRFLSSRMLDQILYCL